MAREQIGNIANKKQGEAKRKGRDKDKKRKQRGRVTTVTDSLADEEKRQY